MHGWLLLVGFALLVVLAIAPYIPRAVAPSNVPEQAFSASRALPHLQSIASEIHPVGSPADARVRDYLIAQLSALELQPQVQHAAVFRGPTGDGVMVDNVLVRLPGTASTGAVLVTAHYDSVVNAPAAGDDGMAVAAMLETVRALRSGQPLTNDLIFLFNDGEEPGMYGSQAFVEQHPWAADVRIVFDFDADSPTGPTTILWATSSDGWLLQQVPNAGSGVLIGAMENQRWREEFHHDLHVFASAGYSGLHFDRVGGSTMYHTLRDNISNVDIAALQQQGDVMLALARHFGSTALDTTRADDISLVGFFGSPLFGYPTSWSLPLALTVGLALVLVCVIALRRRRLTVPRLGGAAAVVFGGAVLLALFAQITWQIIIALHPEALYFDERAFYGQSWFLAGLYLLVVAIVLGAIPWLERRLGVAPLVAAGAGGVVALAMAFALTEPDLTYQATLPAAVGVLMLSYLVGRQGHSPDEHGLRYLAILLAFAALIVGFLVGPLFEPLIGGLAEGPALVIAALVVLMALLVPQLACAAQVGGRRLTAGVAIVGFVLLGIGVANSGFSPDQPRPDLLAYGLDADTGVAYWITPVAPLDEWTSQFMLDATQRRLGELVGTAEPTTVLTAPAPPVHLPPPALAITAQEVASDGLRTLDLHLTSPRQAGRLHLSGTSRTEIIAANFAGKPLTAIEGNEVLIAGLPAEGVDMRVQVRASGPVSFTLIDRSSGLPEIPGVPSPPATVMSASAGEDLSGYPTIVRRSHVLAELE